MIRKRWCIAFLALLLMLAVLGWKLYGGAGLVRMLTPYQDESFGVHSATDYTKTIKLRKGAIVEGFMTVRNGNGEIVFSIEDPYGRYAYERPVLARERLGGFSNFSFKAGVAGTYTLHFDNRIDQTVSKLIFLHYRVR